MENKNSKKNPKEKKYRERTLKTVIILVVLSILVYNRNEKEKTKRYRENMQYYCDEYLIGSILEIPNKVPINYEDTILVSGTVVKEYMDIYGIDILIAGEDVITTDGRDLIKVKRVIRNNILTNYYNLNEDFDKTAIKSVEHITTINSLVLKDYNLVVSYVQWQNLVNFLISPSDISFSLKLKKI